jgi:ABC-2 type transport system ATP-binding protein
MGCVRGVRPPCTPFFGSVLNMIVTQDLAKQFDEFWAVDGIDLHVAAGQVLALLGPNGAGKTTTVRMLTSVLRPTRGQARIAGYDVLQEPEKVRAAVGVLTEQHGLYGRMPAGEYLNFFGQIYGMDAKTRRIRTQKLLDDFGLNDYTARRISEFSKGMRQKLALARALIHNPPVLLLDEPTSAMDPESAHLVRNAIRELRSASRAIIICTHNLAEAEELADQIAIIRRGRIIASGSPTELKMSYLGPAVFEVRLGSALDGTELSLPPGVDVCERGADWLRYKTACPLEANPAVLNSLLSRGLPVVGLFEIPRSLEQVYMNAINAREKTQVEHV